MRIGVAVSGGGHRATAWALGTLAALVETGANAQVVSVSSVSGGSIANGAVAKAGDFGTRQDSEAFARKIAPTLRVVARDGLFFPGLATRTYVLGALGWLGLTLLAVFGLAGAVIAAGRENALAGYALGGAVLGAVLGWKLGGIVRKPRVVLAVAVAVIAGLMTWGGAALTGGLHGRGLLATLGVLGAAWLVSWWVAIVLLSMRGKAVERAFGSVLFAHPTTGRPLTLAEVASRVNHVMCATDLESGDQFYLAPKFLYGFREGITTAAPSEVTLAAAVQASAALPGAFPPSVIATGGFTRDDSVTIPAHPPDRVILSDGGVYDNMADQWEGGLAQRLTVCRQLEAIQEPADVLVVANASEDWEWNPFTARSRLGRELLGLQRDQGVQYDVSTARRRARLLRRPHDDAGRVGPAGVIVMVDRSPVTLSEPFSHGDDEIAARAREALTFVLEQHSGPEWDAMAKRNAVVGTALAAIGAEPTLDLMEHAYTSTVVGLYVLHDIGKLTPFPRGLYAETMR